MNLKLVLSYDGTDFYGWQYQPDRRTVSGEIMRVLNHLIDGKYRLVGVGRTDTGVHALNYVANVRMEGYLRVPLEQLHYKLNIMLPEDIHVKEISTVSDEFHARYSATSKTYRYLFSENYDPLMRRRVWHVRVPPFPPTLNVLFRNLTGTHNFKPLSSDERENGLCTLYDITFGYTGGYVFMDVKGDRFLRRMVRFLASLSIMLTEGKVGIDEVIDSLRSGKRIAGLTPAPPWGLYLLEVEYPGEFSEWE